jgi:hypothetical protein
MLARQTRLPCAPGVASSGRRGLVRARMQLPNGMSPAKLQEAMKDPKIQELMKEAMKNPAVSGQCMSAGLMGHCIVSMWS